jgi:hypothetical protein
MFMNSEKNLYTQVLSIIRNDTGEEIYNSGGVEPGYSVGYDKLKVDLPKGTYQCTEIFYSVDEDFNAVLQTNFECKVTISK